MNRMHLLIGIDDTDNHQSKGTGYLCRQLGHQIEDHNLGRVEGISRHQLLVHEDVPYTSHNSSACLEVITCNYNELEDLCVQYLQENSAEGSDVGLAIVDMKKVPEEVIQFGQKAKVKVLKQQEAFELAEKHSLFLRGLRGTRDGVIGALSAVGLRAFGNDGRMIWVKGKELREMSGVYVAGEIYSEIRVDTIKTMDGFKVPVNAKIDVGSWIRPVIKDNTITLFVEEDTMHENYEWKVISKELIKSISD